MKFVKVRGHSGQTLLLNLDLVEAIYRGTKEGTVDVFTMGDPEAAVTIHETLETMEKLVGLGRDEKSEPLPRRGPTP